MKLITRPREADGWDLRPDLKLAAEWFDQQLGAKQSAEQRRAG